LIWAAVLPLLLLTSCGSRYVVGGAGSRSAQVAAIPPSRSVDVSFQTAISDDEIPVIVPLGDGGSVACQVIDPLHFGVTRFDDSLHARWSSEVALGGPAPEESGPFGIARLAPPAEHPIRMIATAQEADLFSYRRLAGDSIELLVRRFDLNTGRRLDEVVIHRTSFASSVRPEEKIYRSSISPDGRIILLYVVSAQTSVVQRQLDIHLLGSDLSVLAAKRVLVTGRSGRDTLRSASVDADGTIYLLHQDDRMTFDLVRLDVLHGGTPDRLLAKLTDTSSSGTRLGPFTQRIEPDGTLTAVAVGRLASFLSGLAIVRIDLRRWTALSVKFASINSAMVEKLLGVKTFEGATLRSLLTAPGNPRWVAVMEERKRRAAQPKAPAVAADPFAGTTGNIIAVALDTLGQIQWLRGTLKEGEREGVFATTTVLPQMAGGAGMLRMFYADRGELVAREYYLGNGAELSPVPRRLLRLGPESAVLFPFTAWLSDRSALLTLLTGDGSDVRLCRLDLGR
jgi:hypothetical protein